MAGQKGFSGRKIVHEKEQHMFSKLEESGVACAGGALALVFASLSLGAALLPVLAA